MVATPRILIAGQSALAAAFACLLHRAGHEVTLLGEAWKGHEITLRGLWGDCHAGGLRRATTIAELAGTYEMIVLTSAHDASALRPFSTSDSLALALPSDRKTLEAIADFFGPEQTLGARLFGRVIAPTSGEAEVVQADSRLLIGPLEVSDCVMMEQIHRWIRAFQAAHIPCQASADILRASNGKLPASHAN